MRVRNIKYHKTLNRDIWPTDDHIAPDVRDALIALAMDHIAFLHHLGLPISDQNVRDIIVHGSITNYYYDTHSDIDICIIADIEEYKAQMGDIDWLPVHRALMRDWRRQFQFNIRGRDIDLTLMDMTHEEMAPGWYKVGSEYSLIKDAWIHKPVKLERDELAEIISGAHKRVREIEREARLVLRNGSDIMLFLKNQQLRRRASMLAHYAQPLTPDTVAYKMVRNAGMIKRMERESTKRRAEQFNVK